MTKKEMVSLDYMLKFIQKKCDAVAGLKIQNKLLKQENEKLEYENKVLSMKLTNEHHDLEMLSKKYDVLERTHTDYVNKTQNK